MRHSLKRYIASFLLTCFSLVFIHAVTPHGHLDNESGITDPDQNSHDHTHDHSHSGLADILDFLNDLTHSEIGENHLEEYLSSSKQIIPLNLSDLDPCVTYNTITPAEFHSNEFNLQQSLRLSFQNQFLEYFQRRGPPVQS